jgi:hypothetical protein
MNSKQYIPDVFHGKWRFPEKDEFRRQFREYQECMGTLYYNENKPIKLEVYHEPTQGVIARMDGYYDTIWGKDANGYEFTLFNVTMNDPIKDDTVVDISKFVFTINCLILGRHAQSMDEPIFDICTVKFPYLKNWAFQDNREEERNGKLISCTLDLRKGDPFLETEIEDGIKIALVPYSEYIPARYDTTVAQNTYLRVSANKPIPTNRLMQLVFEFSQFLSIALFSNQSPCKIELRIRQEPRRWAFLLYEMEPSTTPYKVPLVKYDRLADKVPLMLFAWHANFEQLSPICNYLIRSLQHNRFFDAPDFLIIAQALDGYYKRFVNKKDGKDIKKYQLQIERLLEQFKGVYMLQECRIDAEELTQSRHKYSHLIPEDDKMVSKAVAGDDLYDLTQKCIVLLTCCILDNIGLTTDEINICFKDSAIQQIVRDLPPTFD